MTKFLCPYHPDFRLARPARKDKLSLSLPPTMNSRISASEAVCVFPDWTTGLARDSALDPRDAGCEWDSWNSSLQVYARRRHWIWKGVGERSPSPPGEGTGMVAVRKDFATFAPSRERFRSEPDGWTELTGLNRIRYQACQNGTRGTRPSMFTRGDDQG
jgi:hypothetical protein